MIGGWRLIGKNGVEDFTDSREMDLDRVPHNFQIHAPIVMYDAIPHPDHFSERDFRNLRHGLGRQMGCGFANDEQSPQYGVLCPFISRKLFLCIAACVLPDCTC